MVIWSCPPRHSAHGQAFRSNEKGYLLLCPSLHTTVSSPAFLLAVIPFGITLSISFCLLLLYNESGNHANKADETILISGTRVHRCVPPPYRSTSDQYISFAGYGLFTTAR